MGGSAISSRARLALLALPFVLIAALAASRLAAGPGWGLLPLLAVGPAVAAAIGGVWYSLAAGVEALVISGLFLLDVQPGAAAHRSAIVVLIAVAGVTAAGMLTSWARERRERQLAEVRLVAEAAQQVVLRPVPAQIGPVRFSVRYLSAASQARVGGDLYDVTAVGDCVRLVVGDAEGKGLPALQSAAEVLGVFRQAANEEGSLAAIVSRMEKTMARRLGPEQFVTVVVAEISDDGAKMELISCGHPPPLLLGASRPGFVTCPASLPLGLGDLSDEPRIPVTIPLAAGDEVLFYTDGATEARNRTGRFFPLAECDSVCLPHRPERLVAQLSAELTKYVGHAPDDDIALLLVYRDSM
jgi:serine phosphatase RsbU (regulator of sigma subunit)